MEKKIEVIKRDGTLEDFDANKVAKVVHAAGLNKDEARLLSEKVNLWIRGLNQNKISSLQIRDKVLEELKLVNKYAADLFQWYEKTKSPN